MEALFHALSVTSLGDREGETVLNLAEETPVKLIFNGLLSYGVMMMTPEDLQDFAIGYCLTEGIVRSTEQIRDIRCIAEEDGMTLDITLDGEALRQLLRRKPRAQTGHTSCGICGSDEVPALEGGCSPLPPAFAIAVPAVRRALKELEKRQTLNAATRMVHGAAWADRDGRILLVREDVGRHNALDKLIGAHRRDKDATLEGFCLLTSRYSFEMALKTLRAGMAIVVAISAPTYRAFRLAQENRQTLIAIARHDGQFLFCGGERLVS